MDLDSKSWPEASSETTCWLRQEDAKEIVRLGHEVLEGNPNSRVFSLGQSPAWIVKAIEKEANHRGRKIETGYIPFSGHFFSRIFHNDELRYQPCLPSKYDQLSPRYREVLKGLALSPDDIIFNFENKHTTTTILEFFSVGRAMASFLYVLFSWAKEDGVERKLREAMDLRLYDIGIRTGKAPKEAAIILDDNIDPIPCHFYNINIGTKIRLWDCPLNARIVTQYPLDCWKYIPGQAEGNKVVVEETEHLLEQEVVKQNCQRSGFRASILQAFRFRRS